MNTSNEMKPGPAAWMFCTKNAGAMTFYAQRHCPPSMSVREFRQELVIRCAEKHHMFDPEKGKPGTWIHWQARAIRKNLMASEWRLGEVRNRIVSGVADSYLGALEVDTEPKSHAAIHLASILEAATPEQRAAAHCIMAGLSPSESSERYGLTRKQVTDHIAELRASIIHE